VIPTRKPAAPQANPETLARQLLDMQRKIENLRGERGRLEGKKESIEAELVKLLGPKWAIMTEQQLDLQVNKLTRQVERQIEGLRGLLE